MINVTLFKLEETAVTLCWPFNFSAFPSTDIPDISIISPNFIRYGLVKLIETDDLLIGLLSSSTSPLDSIESIPISLSFAKEKKPLLSTELKERLDEFLKLFWR